MGLQVDSRYFDYAASAPPWPEALEAFTSISETFYANPSSVHQPGKAAKNKLLALKKEFCDLLNFRDGRLLLTASGSEADNTIIEGHLKQYPKGKVLMAMDVHDSIWYAYVKNLKRVSIFPISSTGHYDLEKFTQALTDDITLVCVNHVSNETGAIQPIREIADLCYQKDIKLLVDGIQAIGHIPVNLGEMPCTYYSVSGHKFGSVRGAAGVFMRDDQFEPLVKGGKQEWEKRAGTENLAALASMVVALKKSQESMEKEGEMLRKLKKYIIEQLEEVPHAMINSIEPDLPSILSVSFRGFSGKEIVGALSMSGFAVSTGSACHANQMEPSRVIRAMGLTTQEAIGAIRISMGPGTTDAAVKSLMENLFDLVK